MFSRSVYISMRKPIFTNYQRPLSYQPVFPLGSLAWQLLGGSAMQSLKQSKNLEILSHFLKQCMSALLDVMKHEARCWTIDCEAHSGGCGCRSNMMACHYTTAEPTMGKRQVVQPQDSVCWYPVERVFRPHSG